MDSSFRTWSIYISSEHGNETSNCTKEEEYFDYLCDYDFLKQDRTFI